MTLISRHFRSGFLTLMAAAVGLGGITGCGGTGQDQGRATDTDRVIRGLALDGHLARSMVFADFDNNGTRDAWEPFAFTDNEGYFSYNPRTQTDYCTVVEYMDFCLRLERAFDEFVVRIDGGYDTMTGEPFAGQISRRIGIEDLDTLEDGLLVTPFTTLISSVKSRVTQDTILASAGLDRLDLLVDYLDRDTQNVDSRLLNKALKIHKVMTILADRVQDEFSEIGSAVGTPNDLTSPMYANLAEALASGDSTLDEILTHPPRLEHMMTKVAQFAQDRYIKRDLVLPAREGAFPEAYTLAIGQIPQFLTLADRLIRPDPGQFVSVFGPVRAVEILTTKFTEQNLTDTHLDQALEFFLNEQNETGVEALVDALDHETADLGSLTRANFASEAFSTSEGILGMTRLHPDVQPFRELPGQRLRVSDMDLGWAPNELRDAEVEFYFKGSETAFSGDFDACVKYIDGASSDGRLGEANTRGELVHGHWSLLNAGPDRDGSYSLILTIRYLNATYQAIMKPAGFEMIDGEMHHKVRFDYANEYRTWLSAAGMQPWSDLPQTDLPQTNADCEQRLPSRIGL